MDFESFEQWWKEKTKPLKLRPAVIDVFHPEQGDTKDRINRVGDLYKIYSDNYNNVWNRFNGNAKKNSINYNQNTTNGNDNIYSYVSNPNTVRGSIFYNSSTPNYLTLISSQRGI